MWQLVCNFCNKRTTYDKVLKKNNKNTDGPKFADPRVGAVSPYFKRSMIHGDMYIDNRCLYVAYITSVMFE